MKTRPLDGIAAVALLATACATHAGSVDPALAQRADQVKQLGPRPIGVIVELEAKPDLEAIAARLAARAPAQRPGALAVELRAHFDRVAPPVRMALERLGAIHVEALWLPHAYAAQLAPGQVREIAAVPGVARVYADANLKAPFSQAKATGPSALKRRLSKQQEKPLAIPPELAAPFDAQSWRGELPAHLAALGIAGAWQRGISGAGVVVAIVDSGVNGRDASVMARFRGGPGDWFDPYRERTQPHDSGGHGTNVATLIAGLSPGKDGVSPIGVAPNARWIASRIYDDDGVGRLSAVHRIYQWVLDPDGRPDTADAPVIVNNSWGLPQTVGRCDLEFARDFAALRMAGVHVVFAAGNEGPEPATSMSPANNPGVLAVGAMSADGQPIEQSGRGPSACGTGAYPQVLAPGVDIESADPASRVMGEPLRVTGTSFAAALASGVLALLASESPAASADQRERALARALGQAGPPAPAAAAPAALAWRPTLGANGELAIDRTTLTRVLPWTARLQRIEVEVAPTRGRLDASSADRLHYTAEAPVAGEPTSASPFSLIAHMSDERRLRIAVTPQPPAAALSGVPSRRLSILAQGGQPARIAAGALAAPAKGRPLTVHASQTIRGGHVEVLDDGSVEYTSRTGFRGVDQFVCTLLGPDGAAHGRVQVAVTVR
jgi:subtilisin family serine protease